MAHSKYLELLYNILEVKHSERLTKDEVHASELPLLFVVFMHMPRYTNDLWLLLDLHLPKILPNLLCSRDSIHFRHADICEDQLVCKAVHSGSDHLVQGFLASDAVIHLVMSVEPKAEKYCLL